MKKQMTADPMNNQTQPNQKPKKNQNNRLQQILAVLIRHKVAFGVSPEKIKEVIEDLGPTYVKLGQILSMRDDLIPVAYADELKKLQSAVKPIPFEEIKEIIENEFAPRKLEEIFEDFEKTPIGSASMAQVHKATILKNHLPVVVKIQRPNIYQTMKQDMELLKRAVSTIQFIHPNETATSFEVLITEMWITAQEEMNFKTEANHLHTMAKNNKSIKYIGFPKVMDEYTSEKVLTMEHIEGIKINDLDTLIQEGYDLKEVGTKLCENYVKQILDDDFFHADPHSGNILVRDGKIIWIDLGMVGKLSKSDLKCIRDIVEAIVDLDTPRIKDSFLALGVTNVPVNDSEMKKDIDRMMNKYASMQMSEMDFSGLIAECIALIQKHKITIPKGISMFVRGVITIQGVVKVIDPSINLIEIISNHYKKNFLSKDVIEANIKEISHNAYASSKKMVIIPSQVSELLQNMNRGDLGVKIEASTDKNTKDYFELITNRICTTIIIAAGILGSSLLCTTNLKPTVLGIPLIGLIGFGLSFLMGVFLLTKTLKNPLLSILKKKQKK